MWEARWTEAGVFRKGLSAMIVILPNDEDQAVTDLSGRTCMITGASNGIGKAAAVALAGMGAELVLVCRDHARGEAAVAEIANKTGNSKVELLLADLGSQRRIRDVADAFLASDRPLHVLLNNAGLILTKRTETEDGIETTFAVNHLAYFLLTNLLLERISKSAPARIVNVSSAVHRRGEIHFDDIGGKTWYGGMDAYAQSKLANILFTRELARRLGGTGVTANALHPGVVATGFGRNNRGAFRQMMRMAAPFLLSPEKGARTSVHLCASPELEGVTGRYFADCKEEQPSAAALDDEAARRLWAISEEMA